MLAPSVQEGGHTCVDLHPVGQPSLMHQHNRNYRSRCVQASQAVRMRIVGCGNLHRTFRPPGRSDWSILPTW